MKLIKVSLTKRATLILLDLERQQLYHPILISADIAVKPPLPEGMSHEQAIGVPGHYRDAYAAWEVEGRAYTNAAVIGWASKMSNIIHFGDGDIQRRELVYLDEQIEELFSDYGPKSVKWTGNEVVDRGLKIIGLCDGISSINLDASKGLTDFLNGVYGRFGITDDEAVGERVKSESGDSPRDADTGSGGADQKGATPTPVRTKRLARSRVLGK